MSRNEKFLSLFDFYIVKPLEAIVLCWQKVGGGINWTWNRDFFSFFFSCYVKIKLVAFTSNVDGSRKFVHITDNLVVERHKDYLPFFYVFFFFRFDNLYFTMGDSEKMVCKNLIWHWKMEATLAEKKWYFVIKIVLTYSEKKLV